MFNTFNSLYNVFVANNLGLLNRYLIKEFKGSPIYWYADPQNAIPYVIIDCIKAIIHLSLSLLFKTFLRFLNI